MNYNSYTTNIIESIDFTNNPCFANDYEMIEKANKNLKLFLSLITDAETVMPSRLIIEKRNELLGHDALDSYSYIVLFEADYYMRLFKLSDKHLERLDIILDLYENPETRNESIQKLNALILINICYYCAGQLPDRPLFSLSDIPISKEQQDLEVSIIYLLRQMNEANLIVSPTLLNPMDMVLSSVYTKKTPVEQMAAEKDDDDSVLKIFNSWEWILVSSCVFVFLGIVIFYLDTYLISKLK